MDTTTADRQQRGPARSRSRRTRVAAGATTAAVAAALVWTTSTLADAAPGRAAAPAVVTTTGARLLPVSGVTLSGTSSRRSVTALRVLDQSGSADDWARYQEYGGHSAGTAYDGYLDLRPESGTVDPSARLTLVVGYRGPAAEQQRWTWSLEDRNDRSWVQVASNAGVPGWGAWRRLEFAVPGTAARFVSSNGSVRVRLTSSNAVDDADLDYLALVPSGDGTGPTSTPTSGSTATSPPPTSGGTASPSTT
uniref:hypothetical protein n=1 Tax=Kineosporia sp. A_224 TaxID=1962180 RepID=UPI0013041F74